MLTPQQAYQVFKKKFPDAKTKEGFDYGDFYVFSASIPGDYVWNDYKIDKQTGELKEFAQSEYYSLSDEVMEKVKDFRV